MKSKFMFVVLLMGLLPQPGQAALKVHEWGTFTSVQGSNGETLTGLEHEEERLPSFVHNRDRQLDALSDLEGAMHCDGCNHCCKGECCDSFVGLTGEALAITQKMETPVLYFYSDKPTKVDVTVDFPKGHISQYYPQPTSFLPPLSVDQVLAGGNIHYSNLEVLSGAAAVPPVVNGNVYGPARETKANFVRANGETEKFIFYRGIGNFKTSLKVTSDQKKLTFADTAGRRLPYLLAVNIRNGKGSFKEIGSVGANGAKHFDLQKFTMELTPTQPLAEFEKNVGGHLAQALEQTGLYKEEALAMVNTWRLSYFHTEGLRVLYVLPREETDALLPITISPQPAELVRTLVGRIEILTTLEEASLLAATKAGVLPDLGRFKEPKLLRVQQLLN